MGLKRRDCEEVIYFARQVSEERMAPWAIGPGFVSTMCEWITRVSKLGLDLNVADQSSEVTDPDPTPPMPNFSITSNGLGDK